MSEILPQPQSSYPPPIQATSLLLLYLYPDCSESMDSITLTYIHFARPYNIIIVIVTVTVNQAANHELQIL